MAKKLKETYIHTDRLPLVVLSAAVAAKNRILPSKTTYNLSPYKNLDSSINIEQFQTKSNIPNSSFKNTKKVHSNTYARMPDVPVLSGLYPVT